MSRAELDPITQNDFDPVEPALPRLVTVGHGHQQLRLPGHRRLYHRGNTWINKHNTNSNGYALPCSIFRVHRATTLKADDGLLSLAFIMPRAHHLKVWESIAEVRIASKQYARH